MTGVMKVLTIITTIFMPLSFIASVYGMNSHDARSGITVGLSPGPVGDGRHRPTDGFPLSKKTVDLKDNAHHSN